METTETNVTEPEQSEPAPKVDEARSRVLSEYDFVKAKRMDNSLAVVEEKYPEGAPDHVIAALLAITVEEVEVEDRAITDKLRRLMKV